MSRPQRSAAKNTYYDGDRRDNLATIFTSLITLLFSTHLPIIYVYLRSMGCYFKRVHLNHERIPMDPFKIMSFPISLSAICKISTNFTLFDETAYIKSV